MEFDIISLDEIAMFKSDYSAEIALDDGIKICITVECGEVAEIEQNEDGDYEVWTNHVNLIIPEEIFPLLLRPITQNGEYYTLKNFLSELTEHQTFMLNDFDNGIIIRAATMKQDGQYVFSPVFASGESKAVVYKELKYCLCDYGDKWAAICPLHE